ncbi:hypothetical protein Q5W_22945 [Hydrogenophaga sp. PBC]|nr:hypothetical protein Q5W_22945 [Hydrogenophaga sp. PBC]
MMSLENTSFDICTMAGLCIDVLTYPAYMFMARDNHIGQAANKLSQWVVHRLAEPVQRVMHKHNPVVGSVVATILVAFDRENECSGRFVEVRTP